MIIHSDQGGNFESAIFTEMCQFLGIAKTRTTPLHPESDGIVERLQAWRWSLTTCICILICWRIVSQDGKSSCMNLLNCISSWEVIRWKTDTIPALVKGDPVWLYWPQRKNGLSPIYIDEIMEGTVLYRLWLRRLMIESNWVPILSQRYVVHCNRLWLYSGSSPPTWMKDSTNNLMINTRQMAVSTPDNCSQTQRRSQRHRCLLGSLISVPIARFSNGEIVWRNNGIGHWQLFVLWNWAALLFVTLIIITVYCWFLHAITIKRLVFLIMWMLMCYHCQSTSNIRFLASYTCATPYLNIKFYDFPTLWLSWIMAIK